MLRQTYTALAMLLIMTLLTGLLYPLVVTGIAQVAFPHQANGSMIHGPRGQIIGSALIGQPFAAPAYFWGRPSATLPIPYDAANSSGSNLGPTNPALLHAVQARVAALKAADPRAKGPIPVDLVTASASGLDPDISPAAAAWQIPRVAQARGLAPATVTALVERHIRGRFLGLLGEPRVNVLELNLALDHLTR